MEAAIAFRDAPTVFAVAPVRPGAFVGYADDTIKDTTMLIDLILRACMAMMLTTPVYTTQQVDPTPPAKVSLAQFQKLRFLEGKWRGTGYKSPFYEVYRFVNDSTIEMGSADEPTFAKMKPGSRIVLRGGSVYSEEGGKSNYAVTKVDQDGYRFTAINRPGFFVWRSVNADEWTALVGNGTVYRMYRLKS
jgi:hypothetical protein